MTIKISRNTVGMYGTKSHKKIVAFDFIDESYQPINENTGKPIVVVVRTFDEDGTCRNWFNMDEDAIKEFAVGLNAKITEILGGS